MAICPACEAELEDDDYADLEVGEEVDCPECGEALELTSLSPVEFDLASDEEEEELEDEEPGELDEEDEEDEDDWDQ